MENFTINGAEGYFAAQEAARLEDEKIAEENLQTAMEEEKKRIELLRQKQIQEKIIKNIPILEEIKKLLKDGQTANFDEHGSMIVMGIPVDYYFEYKTEYSAGSWRYNGKATGKVSIIVGQYGSKTRYPQKKDGTWNYEKIASDLYAFACRKLADKIAEEGRRNNAKSVETFLKDNGVMYSSMFYTSSQPGKPICFRNGNYAVANLSFEDALKLINVMKEVGVIR